MKLNENEEPMKRRYDNQSSQNPVLLNTEGQAWLGPDYWPSGWRRIGYRSVAQALIGNRRSLRIHVKRKIQGGLIIPGMKVAMGCVDAEKFVVVMKLL